VLPPMQVMSPSLSLVTPGRPRDEKRVAEHEEAEGGVVPAVSQLPLVGESISSLPKFT